MIANEVEFQALMREVNAEMEAEGIPVTARQLVATCKVAQKCNLSFPVAGFLQTEPRKDSYSGIDLALRIKNWFADLYGEKLKVDFDLGAVLVEIAGDVYRLRVPTIYGSLPVKAEKGTGYFTGPSLLANATESIS